MFYVLTSSLYCRAFFSRCDFYKQVLIVNIAFPNFFLAATILVAVTEAMLSVSAPFNRLIIPEDLLLC